MFLFVLLRYKIISFVQLPKPTVNIMPTNIKNVSPTDNTVKIPITQFLPIGFFFLIVPKSVNNKEKGKKVKMKL